MGVEVEVRTVVAGDLPDVCFLGAFVCELACLMPSTDRRLAWVDDLTSKPLWASYTLLLILIVLVRDFFIGYPPSRLCFSASYSTEMPRLVQVV